MYHRINDKQFLKKMKTNASSILNQLVQEINKDNKMFVRSFLIGSGAKNLFTQNGNRPIDLDYNIQIFDSRVFPHGREIKEYIRKKFNVVLKNNGLSDCRDSTSVLTTREIYFKKGNQTRFKIDVGIVKQNSYGWHRLVHNKFGNIYSDTYSWEIVRSSRELDDRVKWLKNNNLWLEVRETYFGKKNIYLSRNSDYKDHPSFIVYIESVNEVYNKHWGYNRLYHLSSF